jgi:sortase A
MKLIVKSGSLWQLVSMLRAALLALSFVLLGYCAYVLGDAWMFQAVATNELENSILQQRGVDVGTGTVSVPVSIPAGGLIGRIEITRLGLSAVVMEGTSSKTLRRAVGHIEGTALPGTLGNVGLSGHRDRHFRPLRNIKRNDEILLTTLAGRFQYRVVSTQVVQPTDVSVLESGSTEVLTLVTCFPFYYVGPAPDRFVVRAERVR